MEFIFCWRWNSVWLFWMRTYIFYKTYPKLKIILHNFRIILMLAITDILNGIFHELFIYVKEKRKPSKSTKNYFSIKFLLTINGNRKKNSCKFWKILLGFAHNVSKALSFSHLHNSLSVLILVTMAHIFNLEIFSPLFSWYHPIAKGLFSLFQTQYTEGCSLDISMLFLVLVLFLMQMTHRICGSKWWPKTAWMKKWKPPFNWQSFGEKIKMHQRRHLLTLAEHMLAVNVLITLDCDWLVRFAQIKLQWRMTSESRKSTVSVMHFLLLELWSAVALLHTSPHSETGWGIAHIIQCVFHINREK